MEKRRFNPFFVVATHLATAVGNSSPFLTNLPFTILPIISTTNSGSPFGKIVKRQVCQKGG
jgi:hypothetical protein